MPFKQKSAPNKSRGAFLMPVLMGRDSGLLCVFYTSGERRGVGVPILDLAPCYARFDGCTRHGRGDDREQTRVARFRNQVFASERERLQTVCFRTSCGTGSLARRASAWVTASFISSLIVLAYTSSAPRKRYGKATRCLPDWDSPNGPLRR